MGDLLPGGALETKDYLYKRAQKAREVMNQILAEMPVEGDEVVPVVFHSQMIAALTCEGVEGEGNNATLKNKIWTQNTQVVPIESE